MLRHQGFSSAMHVFMKMGLFENRSSKAQKWYELLEESHRHQDRLLVLLTTAKCDH